MSPAELRTGVRTMLDLNVVWQPQNPGVYTKMLAVAQTLGYDVVALNFVVHAKGKLPPNPFSTEFVDSLEAQFPRLRILRRITIIMEDRDSLPSNIRGYDLVAVQPRSEKVLQNAATTLDVDLISLDMTTRPSFYLKHKISGAAVSRGVHFEVCYGPATAGDSEARRQCVANAVAVFRATRGRGCVVSSGAVTAASLRAPLDVVNLVTVWGLNSDRARESVDKQPREAAVTGFLRLKSAKQAVFSPPLSADHSPPRTEHEEPPPKRQKV